ncbi:hypothetical protein Godav_016972 [Gossypium davidsonii]|uniref:HMA domain-containing protein n=1 Tax=Gossypium davidsonii TaxID=34287 RepID=A0A7J8QT40_GOSDV|nr:hypothetical protein [Gossypium davidsonii]
MTCTACSNSVETTLKNINGVLRASVALLQNLADVVFYPTLVKDEDIKNTIEDVGFEAEILPKPNNVGTKPRGVLVGQFTIGGMTYATCVNSVESILRDLSSVRRVVVALATLLGEVEYDPTVISKDDIVNTIKDVGFEAALVQSSEHDKIILGVAGVFNELDVQLIEGILSSLKEVRQFRFDRSSGELEVLFDPEVRFYVAADRALRNGSTNMDVLVALGTSASYFYSVGALLYGVITGFWSPTYFETSSMLITFVLLGKYLECLEKGKTSDAIKKLVELAPATALLVVKDNSGNIIGENEVDALLIQPGDILKVLSGAKYHNML